MSSARHDGLQALLLQTCLNAHAEGLLTTRYVGSAVICEGGKGVRVSQLTFDLHAPGGSAHLTFLDVVLTQEQLRPFLPGVSAKKTKKTKKEDKGSGTSQAPDRV